MKKLRIAVLLVTVISLMGLILACPSGGTGSTPPVTKTPKASDYNVSGTGKFIFAAGTSRPVTVQLKPEVEGSPGAIAVKYKDAEGNPLSAAPSAVGSYSATFDVAAAPGWDAAEGLFAGVVDIGRPDFDFPERDDFTVSGFPVDMKAGDLQPAINIVPKAGKSQGAITITYTNTVTNAVTTTGPNGTGGTGFPTTVGLYNASFAVAEDATNRFNAVSGLNAGTVLITDPNSSVELKDLKFEDFDISIGKVKFPSDKNSSNVVKIQYNEKVQRVEIVDKIGYPLVSSIRATYYEIKDDGSLASRFDANDVKGKYKVVLEVPGYVGTTSAWTPAEFNLYYDIEPRKPLATDYVITGLIQSEAGKSFQDLTRDVTHVRIVRKPTWKLIPTGSNYEFATNGDKIRDKEGISSKGKITVFYEKIEGAEAWKDTTEIDEKFLGANGKRFVSRFDYDVIADTTKHVKPPQDAGKYRVKFKVAKPDKDYIPTQIFPEAADWVKADTRDIENWEGTADGEFLDGGTFELRELLPFYPTFVNAWIDADDDVVKVSTPNDQQYMLPNGQITFNFTGAGTVLEWRVDGSTVATSGNSLNFTSKALGRHVITVLVTYKHTAASEAKIYSNEFKVLVVDRMP